MRKSLFFEFKIFLIKILIMPAPTSSANADIYNNYVADVLKDRCSSTKRNHEIEKKSEILKKEKKEQEEDIVT